MFELYEVLAAYTFGILTMLLAVVIGGLIERTRFEIHIKKEHEARRAKRQSNAK